MSRLSGAVRPTVRDVRHHPWRSLAAILLIMIPVAFYAHTTIQSDSHQQFYDINSAKTTAWLAGSSCEQNHDGSQYTCDSNDTDTAGSQTDKTSTIRVSLDSIRESLGSDFQVEPSTNSLVRLTFAENHATDYVTQITDSKLLPGSPELGSNKIILAETTAHQLSAKVGDVVTAEVDTTGDDTPDKTLELAVAQISPGATSYVASPTFIDVAEIPVDAPFVFFIGGNRDITWDEIKKLNQIGLVVSAEVFSKSPQHIDVAQMYPRYQADLKFAQENTTPSSYYYDIGWRLIELSLQAVLGIILLCLISPVFAIATSRQTKVYALMRAQGASKWHILLAVLAYGFIAGLIGAFLGAIIGTVSGVVSWNTSFPGWPVSLSLDKIVLAVILAIIGSTIAAFLPAILAAKGTIMAGVEGSQPDRIRRWKNWMAIGPIGLVIVGVLSLIMSTLTPSNGYQEPDKAWQIVAHSLAMGALINLGLIFIIATIPALVYSTGKFRKPLAIKLAGRLVRRQAFKSGAIMAAMLAVISVFGVVSINMLTTSKLYYAHQAASFSSRFLTITEGSSFVSDDRPIVPAADYAQLIAESPSAQVAAAITHIDSEAGLTRTLPLYGAVGKERATVIDVTLPDQCQLVNEDSMPSYSYQGKDASTDSTAAEHCWYLMKSSTASISQLGFENNIVVGGAEVLDLFNLDPAAKEQAAQVLSEGGVVGSSAIMAAHGDQTVAITTFDYAKAGDLAEDEHQFTVPFAAVLPADLHGWIFSPKAVEKAQMGLRFSGYGVVTEQPLDRSQITKLQGKISPTTSSLNLDAPAASSINTSYETLVLGGLLLLILGLVLVLSAEQVTRQNEQLYALGAPISLIRTIGAYYGGMVAVLGTLPALLIAHIGALFLMSPDETNINGQVLTPGTLSHYQVDWAAIGILGIAVPVLSALMGYLATRSKNLLSYRQD